MATGTIKSLLFNKGFGFIVPDNAPGDDSDVFFHQSAMDPGAFDQLTAGERVQYDDEADPRNPGRRRAANVTTIDV